MKLLINFRTFGLLFLLQIFYKQILAGCYFPPQFQGEFKMQSSLNSGTGGVQYSTLNIAANAIPIWGNCHRRIGNNFILIINLGENSCIRCLHLSLRSRNVLLVHAINQEAISKCYTNEETAVSTCPSEESLQNHSAAEIILFKTKEMEGGNIREEYCPISGSYSLTYKINDLYNKRECLGSKSSLDTCPSGSTLNLRFRHCNLESFDLNFVCLGNWKGSQQRKYLALIDSRYTKDQKPQYRCALYKTNTLTKVIHMALSKDSTCTTDLFNETHGYETLTLTPKEGNNWPLDVSYSQCSFPKWLTGSWEQTAVQDDTLVYKDPDSFKTYTVKCVGTFDSNNKYLVFIRTQCNDEQYNCMKIQERSSNIFEFQLGSNFSSKHAYDLCSESNFQEGSWITQGRIDKFVDSSCPISGEYTGVIPDSPDLCAKLWSDCRAPELMYYQVSDCETNEIYEEREYKCLGHWREDELLYTYTERRDIGVGIHECFVGSIISNKEDIYIKEAGEHCQRQIDPLRHGMKLNKQGLYSCIGHVSTVKYDTNSQTPVWLSSTHISTKPWNIDRTYPTVSESDNTNNSTSYRSCLLLIFTILVMNIYF